MIQCGIFPLMNIINKVQTLNCLQFTVLHSNKRICQLIVVTPKAVQVQAVQVQAVQVQAVQVQAVQAHQ